jgi:hypothetical protein
LRSGLGLGQIAAHLLDPSLFARLSDGRQYRLDRALSPVAGSKMGRSRPVNNIRERYPSEEVPWTVSS